MKRRNLPKIIIIKTKYGRMPLSKIILKQGETITGKIRELKNKGFYVRLIEVLQKNLEGVTDLHGQNYKPTKWIFANLNYTK